MRHLVRTDASLRARRAEACATTSSSAASRQCCQRRASSGTQGPGPHRRCWRHQTADRVAHRAAPVVLGRVHPAREHPGPARQDPRQCLDVGLRRARPGPGRRLGRRADRTAGAGLLAGRDASHRPQGTPPPGRAGPRPTTRTTRSVTAPGSPS